MKAAEKNPEENDPRVFEQYMREKHRLKALVKQAREVRRLQKEYFALPSSIRYIRWRCGVCLRAYRLTDDDALPRSGETYCQPCIGLV